MLPIHGPAHGLGLMMIQAIKASALEHRDDLGLKPRRQLSIERGALGHMMDRGQVLA